MVSSTVGVSTDPTGGDEGHARSSWPGRRVASALVPTPANAAGISLAVITNGGAAGRQPVRAGGGGPHYQARRADRQRLSSRRRPRPSPAARSATIMAPAILLGGERQTTRCRRRGAASVTCWSGGAGGDSLDLRLKADVPIGGGGARTRCTPAGGATCSTAVARRWMPTCSRWRRCRPSGMTASDSLHDKRVQNLFGTGSGGLQRQHVPGRPDGDQRTGGDQP